MTWWSRGPRPWVAAAPYFGLSVASHGPMPPTVRGRDPGVMITVEGLSKTYGGFTAIDDVSFVCRPGTVTGFLGPNGAGKSTTMRIMVGLTPPSKGRTTVGGHHYRDIPNPGRHVGVLLDASAQHGGRTGREVLNLGAQTMGLPKSRVDEMLELVSLTQAEAKRRVGNYSLGMRQRLGIAHALLGDPSILILDEPANGLDPAGIHWMRGLLRDYANRGGTVLLSSHLLREVEVIADEMILIGNGRIVAQGSKAELLQTAGTFVRALEPEKLATALRESGIEASPSGDSGLRTDAEPVQVGKVAAAAGVTLVELRPADGAGLEEMFLQLTADNQREGVPA
jgi:ABC-2 type transport system ATP-binding protein